MRILVGGKGGVGKTTVASILARQFSEAGTEVIAIDADGSPNLAMALGVGDPELLPAVANSTPPRTDDACDTPPLDASSILESFSVAGDTGITLVQTGRIERPSERCLCCGSHSTTREVIAAMESAPGRVILADLEPGLNDLLWARPRPGDVLIVVMDMSKRSGAVAQRMVRVAKELGLDRIVVVANKVIGDEPPVRSDDPAIDVVVLPHLDKLEGATPDGRHPHEAKRIFDLLTDTPVPAG